MPISFNNPTWEYQILWMPDFDAEPEEISDFDEDLAEAGLSGWEAVSMSETRLLLKRQLV